MRRVLIISYFYPPYPTVGALRPARLFRHLPEFEWEPIILTARIPGEERPDPHVVETGYRDVLSQWKRRIGLDGNGSLHAQLHLQVATTPNERRLHTKFIEQAKAVIAFPDAMRGWTPFAIQALKRCSRRMKFDAILSTSPPMSSHIIAAEAAAMLRRPWVADFRDLWDGGWITRSYERIILRRADALVTVSDPLAEQLRDLYPQKLVQTITNSFEADEVPNSPPSGGPFTISYTGTLYEGKRDPTVLLTTLRALIQEQLIPAENVRVQFYGAQEPFLYALIERLGLRNVVSIHQRVSHAEALKVQAESHLLLLVDWDDVKARGIYTAKVFEYLAAARPILALGPTHEGVVPELLNESGAGALFTTEQELRPFLLGCYQEWQKQGYVGYHGNSEVISRYDSRTMARKFAALLDSVHLETPVHI